MVKIQTSLVTLLRDPGWLNLFSFVLLTPLPLRWPLLPPLFLSSFPLTLACPFAFRFKIDLRTHFFHFLLPSSPSSFTFTASSLELLAPVSCLVPRHFRDQPFAPPVRVPASLCAPHISVFGFACEQQGVPSLNTVTQSLRMQVYHRQDTEATPMWTLGVI